MFILFIFYIGGRIWALTSIQGIWHSFTIRAVDIPFLPCEVKPNPRRMTHSTLRKRTARRRSNMEVLQGPRRSTINAILNFSKALKVVEVPPIGQVDIILN